LRLVSFLAPTCKKAMSDLRTNLGEDAVIVSTETLDDGQVRVTGAVADDLLDLAGVLGSSDKSDSFDWLGDLGHFHEWPFAWHQDFELVLSDIVPADPEVILATLLQALYSFGHLLDGSRKPLFFSGSPGAGTTITGVKVAAAQVLKGQSVDFLTLDVDRVGALDRLTALLAPLDLAPTPVPTPTDLNSILAQCAGDVILIDGQSMNPFLPSDLGSLSAIIAQSGAELIPVMSATHGYGDASEIARGYIALGAKSIVVTKLDAVRRLGGLMAVAGSGLSIAEVGVGPSIGDGLCELHPDGLARLLFRRYQGATDEGVGE